MYCEKCGTKVESEGDFCPNCGCKLGSHDIMEQAQPKPANTMPNMADWSKTQPTEALVVEIFAVLCFAVSFMDTGSAIVNVIAGLIGTVLLTTAYFLLRAVKKKNGLMGFGYVGYVIACAGMVIVAFFAAFIGIGVVGAVLAAILR